MSLHEELKNPEPREAFTFSRLSENKKLSEELERQMDEFLAKGGKISQGKIGELAQDRVLINEFTGQNDFDRRKQAQEKASEQSKKPKRGSMHSKFNPTAFEHVYRSSSDSSKFVGIIGKTASQELNLIQDARNWVDYQLRKLKRN